VFIWIKRDTKKIEITPHSVIPRGPAAVESVVPSPLSVPSPPRGKRADIHAVEPEKIGALLVAIDEYPNEKWRLYKCKTDAIKFRKILKNVYNVPAPQIRILYDAAATKHAILQGIDWLVNSFEYCVLFMSGHGCRVFANDGPGDFFVEVFVAHDHTWSRAGMLLDRDIRARLARAKRAWVVIDACHSAGLARNLAGVPGRVRSISPPVEGVRLGVVESVNARDVVELAACMSHQQAFELEDGGAFTSILCRLLTEFPDATFEELQDKLRAGIGTNQTPVITAPASGLAMFTI